MKFVRYLYVLVAALFVLAWVGSVDAASPFAKVGSATTAGRHQQDQRQPKEVTEIAGTIERWVDGDTCVFVADSGEKVHIYLWILDAPEANQLGGAMVAEYIRSREDVGTGKRVVLKEVWTDKSGRIFGELKGESAENYCTADLLASGYFWLYEQRLRDLPKEQAEQLKKIFKETKDAKKGIFKYENAMPPWEWRKMPVEEKDSIRAEFERQAFGIEPEERSH